MKKYMKAINVICMVVFAVLAVCGVITMGPAGMAIGFMGVVTLDATGTAVASRQGGISAVGRVFQLMNRVTIPLTLVTNDIVKAIPVKLGTKVLSTTMRTVTQASDSTELLLKLGDGDNTGGFQNTTLDAQDGGVALTQTLLPADTYGVTPKVYAADDTIDILLSTVTLGPGTIPAVIDIMALCEDTTADAGDYTTNVVAGSS